MYVIIIYLQSTADSEVLYDTMQDALRKVITGVSKTVSIIY